MSLNRDCTIRDLVFEHRLLKTDRSVVLNSKPTLNFFGGVNTIHTINKKSPLSKFREQFTNFIL